MRRGFTLIELMISVAIIAMLASMAIPLFSNYALKAKESEAKINLRGMQASINSYYAARGIAPDRLGIAPNVPLFPHGKKNRWSEWPNPAWSFQGIVGFKPAGDVYFQYICNAGGMVEGGPLVTGQIAVVCSASADLNGTAPDSFVGANGDGWNVHRLGWKLSEGLVSGWANEPQAGCLFPTFCWGHNVWGEVTKVYSASY